MQTTVIASVLIFAVGSAAATTFIVGSDADLLAAADVVVVGKVRDFTMVARGSGIETRFEVDVAESIKGSAPQSVTVAIPGGILDGQRQKVFGTAQLDLREDVLLFLRKRGDGIYTAAQMAMGKYHLVGKGRDAIAVRALPGAARGRRRGRLVSRSPLDIRRLSELVASLRGEAHGPVPDLPQSPDGGIFGTLGSKPSRWHEVDEGRTIEFIVQASGAAVTGLDTDWAVAQAVDAWSHVDCSALHLATSGGGQAAPSNACDGKSQIIFGDPFDEVEPPVNCAGVLGVGSICSVHGEEVVSGLTFDRITEGDVVINDGFENCPFWNEVNLSEVLTHEIGHTLGLGHSSESSKESSSELKDAVMYFRSHRDGRGAAIMEDDRAGICTFYPKQETGLELDHALVSFAAASDSMASRLKISGRVRPEHDFDPVHDDFSLVLRSGNAVRYRTTVSAGAWRNAPGSPRFSALSRGGGAAIETITLVREEGGSYKLRLRARNLDGVGPPQDELMVEVVTGTDTMTSPLTLRSRSVGQMIFP